VTASTLVIPANLQWVGAAKETAYGTPAAAPTIWIPVDGSSVKWKPNQAMLSDQALRGLMGVDFQQVQGMRYDTLDYKSYLYMDSVYQHFLAILGTPDAVTGTTDPWLHKTSLLNAAGSNEAQPISFTMFYFDGAECWQIPGCMLAQLKTTVKVDALTTLEASWMGLPATKMGAAPVNTPSTSKPIPAWSGTISLGGTALSQFSSVELDYKRDAAAVNTINASQSPLAIFSGGFTVSGQLTALFQGGTDVNMTDYLANTQPPLVVKSSPIGDVTHFLQLQSSVVAYDSSEVVGSNKWMEVQAQFKGLMNATDALDSKQSPCQVQLSSTAQTAF
jgi:hypothetical protein